MVGCAFERSEVWGEQSFDAEAARALVRAYNAQRPFTDYEREALPVMMVLLFVKLHVFFLW